MPSESASLRPGYPTCVGTSFMSSPGYCADPRPVLHPPHELAEVAGLCLFLGPNTRLSSGRPPTHPVRTMPGDRDRPSRTRRRQPRPAPARALAPDLRRLPVAAVHVALDQRAFVRAVAVDPAVRARLAGARTRQRWWRARSRRVLTRPAGPGFRAPGRDPRGPVRPPPPALRQPARILGGSEHRRRSGLDRGHQHAGHDRARAAPGHEYRTGSARARQHCSLDRQACALAERNNPHEPRPEHVADRGVRR